jgi:hypothetical protein
MDAWKVYLANARRVPVGVRSGLHPA